MEPTIGGAPAVAAQLAGWEARSGLRVGLVGHPRSAALNAPDLPFDTIALDLSLGPRVLPATRMLARRLRQSRVVHLHSSRAALIGRVANLGYRRPTVFTPHGWSWYAVSARARPAAVATERLLNHTVDVLHVLSDSEAEEASTMLGLAQDRIALIPNGVDLDRFTCPANRPDPHEARPLEVLVLGRLCRQKGQDLLLGALASAALPRAVHLTVAGGGPAEAELRELTTTLPAQVTVTFLGPVDDPVPLYHATDLAVFPSRWEGQSLALLEAIATGCPIIATSASGTEVGRGWLATCEATVDGLAGALRRHLADPALLQALGDGARQRRSAVGEDRVRDLHLALKARMLSAS
ncbi:MAG: glycosyl transferase [Acidimicrobiales bacterium]|nr:glycosyl transferase [Acidimicrobiales bacterium]